MQNTEADKWDLMVSGVQKSLWQSLGFFFVHSVSPEAVTGSDVICWSWWKRLSLQDKDSNKASPWVPEPRDLR